MANLKKKRGQEELFQKLGGRPGTHSQFQHKEVPCFMSHFEDRESQCAYVMQPDIIHYYTDTDQVHHHLVSKKIIDQTV